MAGTVQTLENTIPVPHRGLIETAVREGIGDLPGVWQITLLADRRNDIYQVKIRQGDGPEWKREFSGPWEHEPEVIRKRIGGRSARHD